MKTWFYGLDDREQKFVMSAAAFVLIAILYLGFWLPLDKAHTQASSSAELWRTSLAQLAPLKGRLGQQSGSQATAQNINQPLVVVVDTSLRVRKLNQYLQGSQPTGNNIRVDFENVAFDDLMLWLGDLNNQYALHVQSGAFTIEGDQIEGRVNAQMTLGR